MRRLMAVALAKHVLLAFIILSLPPKSSLLGSRISIRFQKWIVWTREFFLMASGRISPWQTLIRNFHVQWFPEGVRARSFFVRFKPINRRSVLAVFSLQKQKIKQISTFTLGSPRGEKSEYLNYRALHSLSLYDIVGEVRFGKGRVQRAEKESVSLSSWKPIL